MNKYEYGFFEKKTAKRAWKSWLDVDPKTPATRASGLQVDVKQKTLTTLASRLRVDFKHLFLRRLTGDKTQVDHTARHAATATKPFGNKMRIDDWQKNMIV